MILVQGSLIKMIIPSRLTEESAAVLCLLCTSFQLLAFGLCPSLLSFYVVVVVLAPSSMYSPSLKALLSNAGGASKQGELQGALSGLRTLSAGVGALLFSWIYSFSGGAVASAAHALTGSGAAAAVASAAAASGSTNSATSELIDENKLSSLQKMMSFSSSILVSDLHKSSSYFDYIIFALEEGFPFFVAAWLHFVAFLFMMYYVRNLSAFKGSTLSQHSLTRGAAYSPNTGARSRLRSDSEEEDEEDENSFFYKI